MRHQSKIFSLLIVFCGLTSCASLQFGVEQREVEVEGPFWYFDTILFEIAPVGSFCAPDPKALDLFRERLHQNRLCHRDNVSFIVHERSRFIGPLIWNGGTISAYESMNRTIRDLQPDDRNLVAFVSYVMGPFQDGAQLRVLGGLQYGPTSFAIFKDGAGDREAGVLLHEFGHLIGMVKNVNRANHDDNHRHHCANKKCAMFWSTPSEDADFDFYCKRYVQRRILERLNE